MDEWKLYKRLCDVDGSYFWFVNGESLQYYDYHIKHDAYVFYYWNREALEEAVEADQALSILADYFGEQPSKEQLEQGQCKCWRFHIDFKSEMVWRTEVTSNDIADWIERKTKQFTYEEELMGMLKKLSIPIFIKKDYEDYVWGVLDYRGTAPTFSDALMNALEYQLCYSAKKHVEVREDNMNTPPLLKALRPQGNSIRRAQRKQLDGDYLHVLTILCNPSGYRLIRSIINTLYNVCEDEQIWDYRYLTDLFAAARREGFFDEVTPHAPDWIGYTEPKPIMSSEEEERLQEEEEKFQYEWDIDHPEEVREEELIEANWQQLGKNEVITYEDELYDDGGYEFSWTEPDEDDYGD